MSRLHVSRPSPAMIVAVAALVVALGGSAYAVNKVGTKQLKKNAVSTKKIKDDAVTAAKLANNAVTQAKLANGAASGDLNIVMRHGPSVGVPPSNPTTAEASCQPGERATGGGVFNKGVQLEQIVSSYPTPNPTPPSDPTGDGASPTGWRVVVTNLDSPYTYPVFAYVICVS